MRLRSFLPSILFVSTIIVSLAISTAGAVDASSVGSQNDDQTDGHRHNGQAELGGTVRFVDGSPVAGVVVDFFAARDNGLRGRFLGDERTNKDGSFQRAVKPGCYVLVFIAPHGNQFIGGNRYLEARACPKAGDQVTNLDAVLAPDSKQATLGGTVRFVDGSPVAGVVVDFFAARDNGLRGRFLGDERTNKDGSFQRAVKPGCYVLVFIAPHGNQFIGGGVYDERPVCVPAGEVVNVDAQLTSSGSACIIQDQVVDTPLTGSDCDVLLTLYTTTDGPNWIAKDGWNTPTDPCTWFGLTCSGSRLEAIDLDNNGLSGPIPADLGLLSDLVRLDLELNQSLTGPIPPELGQLADLRVLILSFTPGLTGPIPPELGQLTNLRFLNMEISGALTGPIPPELGQLTELENLYIRRGRLTGPIPPELGQLKKLKQLLLDSNQLSGPIPIELANLTLMEDLLLDGNQLSGPIPPELSRLVNLEQLWLSNNQLTGSLPAGLGQIPRLEVVQLDRNLLSGDITAAMGGMRNFGTVQRLDLGDGPGGNSCFTVTEEALADWISMFDPDWDECEKS